MTREQLEEFDKGIAFIDMTGTTEKDWIELINQCNNVGIDLNNKAKNYYSGFYICDLDSVQPFVYYQREWNDTLGYLKCTHTALSSYKSNTIKLKVHMYEPGKQEDILPMFEI